MVRDASGGSGRYRPVVRPVVKSQAAYPSELAAPVVPPAASAPAAVDPAVAAGARRASGTGASAKTGRTGIVVVHGIGSQQPAETLLQWTAPLIEVLTAWRAAHHDDAGEDGRPMDPVRTAAIDFSSPFPTISLHVPAARVGGRDFAAREWLVTEAWWASNVAPPGLSTMITWLGPGGGVGRIVDGILGNEDASRSPAILRAFLVPLVSVLAGLALTVYGLVRSLTALIPIEGLREAAVLRQFDEFLIGWFGDVRILLFDPAQSANIRGGLAGAIQRLRERCDEVVVVAHSGGAMISYLTLTDPELAPSAQVDKLVTFGEGWNLALRLTPDGAGMADRLRRDITTHQPHLRWQDFHASHDPAPAGPLALAEIRPHVADPTRIRTTAVWNRRSVVGDHGGYFDNDEEFTLPLLRELDVPSGWGEASRFYPPDGDGGQADRAPALPLDDPRIGRHRQRVALLALWRQTVVALTVATVAFALGWVPERLVDIGREVGSLLPRVPVVADVVDAIRTFATSTLESWSFSLPLLGRVAPGDVAGAVDVVGFGVLQAVVIMSGLYLLAARGRAFLAWPAGSPIGGAIWLVELALIGVVAGAVVSIAFAPDHGALVGAGIAAWAPGIVVTALTGVVALIGTTLAAALRSAVVSNAYAWIASVLFLGALACSLLTILRDPEREWAEIAYVAIWGGAWLLLSAGAARWSAWDRAERRIAYGPVAAVPVERRPVLVTSAGMLVLAAALMLLVLVGPNEWVVYGTVLAAALVVIGAISGAAAWRGAGNPVAAPEAVESARGSV